MRSCARGCRSSRWSCWASRPSALGRNGAGVARAASRSSSAARGRGCGSTTRKAGAAGSRISSAVISAWRARMRPTGSRTGSGWASVTARCASALHHRPCRRTIWPCRRRHRAQKFPRRASITMATLRQPGRTRPPRAQPGSGPAHVPPRRTIPISSPSRQRRSPCAWTRAAGSSCRCRTSTAGSTVSRPSRPTGPSVSSPVGPRRAISRWWARARTARRSPPAPS